MITGASSPHHNMHHVRRQAALAGLDEDLRLEDVSKETAVLALMGPNSRDILHAALSGSGSDTPTEYAEGVETTEGTEDRALGAQSVEGVESGEGVESEVLRRMMWTSLLSDEAFPFATVQTLHIPGVGAVTAMRISYVEEVESEGERGRMRYTYN